MENPGIRTPSLRLQMGDMVVVLLSLGALAALIAVMPSVAAVSPAPTAAHVVSAIEPKLRYRDGCEQCAVVTAIREIEPLGHEGHSGAGSSATKDIGNVMTEESARRYDITVRMRDGSIRVIEKAGPANWRVDERLILIGGTSISNESEAIMPIPSGAG